MLPGADIDLEGGVLAEIVFRLFVSSPGDVPAERRRVELAAERLNSQFAGRVRIETVRWETKYYSAHQTFQNQIPEAADCDVVVAVFRARLGSPLPRDFPNLPTGEPYPSGTAYEVLSAIEARKAGKGLPDVYVFRYPSAPSVALDAPDRADIESQWQRLKEFFDSWFRTKDGQFVAAFQSYTSIDDFADKVEECLRQWLGRRGFLPQGLVWDRIVRGSPFPGLSAFETDRKSVFFGRDLVIAQAIERLRGARSGEEHLPFLLVIGASGAGKSSLLRAGLMPQLTLPGTIPEIDLWRMAIVTPGIDPFLSIAEALFSGAAFGPELMQGAFRTKELLAKQLRGDVDTAVALMRDALDKAANARKLEANFDTVRPARLALAIDQAERLFVEADADAAVAVANFLSALVRQNLVYLVFTMRSDAYARFQSIEALVGLREAGATFDLVPPTAAELEEIAVRPVAACDPPLRFEEKDGRSLATLLVFDAKGGDALPLMQMTLSRLYTAEAGRGDGVLRFVDYRGMDAAVTETANEALDMLSQEARAELPALVAGLVTDVAADPLTGGPVPVVTALDRRAFEATRPARTALVDAFVGKRLLTAEGDGVLEQVRPVHEALLRIWPQAVTIINETASLIRVRRTLDPMVREWQIAGDESKKDHLEISPALLHGAQQLLGRFGDDLPPEMHDFIIQAEAVDAARRDRERKEHEKRLRDAQALAEANRQTAQRTGFGLVAALVLVALAVWQWRVAQVQKQLAQSQTAVAQTQTQVAQTETLRAEKAAREADAQRDQAVQSRSGALAALANLRINAGDVGTAALLALEAVDQQFTPEAEGALVNSRLHLREFASLPVRATDVSAVGFSADSRLVITASSDEAYISDAANGQRLATLIGHRDKINAARFSQDGSLVATASDDGTVRIWDGHGAKTTSVLTHTGQVLFVAFSRDGTRVVTASRDKTAIIWNTKSGQAVAVLAGHTNEVRKAVFSPDDKLVLTVSRDGTARIWDAGTGKEQVKFGEHNDEVSDGAFSADGKRVVTASYDQTAKVWEATTGKLISTLKGHSHRVFSADFIPNTNHVVTGSYDQTARIWDADTGVAVAVLAGHQGVVMQARPSADGRSIVTASTDRTARIWDAATGTPTAILSGHQAWVTDAVFSPNGQLVATAAQDRTARLWVEDAVTIEVGKDGNSYRLWKADISPDGSRAVGPSAENSARIWDAQSGEALAVLQGHTATVSAAAFDAHGERVITVSGDGTARIWNARTGKLLVVLSGHTGAVQSAAFSADGKRAVTGGNDETARIWDTHTGELLTTIVGHQGTIVKVAFSPNGKRVITVSPFDQTVRLWDTDTGKPAGPGIVQRGEIWSAAFSPDGRRIATARTNVTIFDAETGDFISDQPQAGERIIDISYSADGRYLLTASLDRTARIADAETGRPISLLTGFVGGVWSIAISADGRRLMTGSGGQTLKVARLGSGVEGLVRELKSVIPRCLTVSQRADFKLAEAPPEWCFELRKWPYQSSGWQLWHSHKEDAEKPPQPESSEWLSWVRKQGEGRLDKRPAEALPFFEEAANYAKDLADSNKQNSRLALTWAVNEVDLGRVFKALNRNMEAVGVYQVARDILIKQSAAEPDRVALREELGYIYELMGSAFSADDKQTESIAAYRLALDIRQRLADAEPNNLDRLGTVAYLTGRLTEALLAAGYNIEAQRSGRDYVDRRQKLADAEPKKDERRVDLAYSLRVLGDVLTADARNIEAIAAYRQCINIRQKLADAQPQDADRLNDLAYAEDKIASRFSATENYADALVFYAKGLELREKLAATEPGNEQRNKDVISLSEDLGQTAFMARQPDKGAAYFRKALDLREKFVMTVESQEIAANGRAGTGTTDLLGGIAWDALFLQDFDKAIAASRRALELMPDQLWIRTNLAHGLMFLNKSEEARAMYLEYRGRKTSANKTWEQLVLGDFVQFHKVGFSNPLMDEIEKLFGAKT